MMVLIVSCRLDDLSLQSPTITSNKDAQEKFDHTKFEKSDCLSCHEQNKPQTTPPHGDNLTCISCHTAVPNAKGIRSWLNISKIVHSQNMSSCVKCHLTADRDSRPEPKEFHPSPKYSKIDCVFCHQASTQNNSWKKITFDHKKHDPVPSTCIKCHEGIRPTSHTINPKDPSMKNLDCFSCHGSMIKWEDKLKKFDHELNAPTSCVKCHSGDTPKNELKHPSDKENYSKIDCFQCHSYQSVNSKLSFKNLVFNHKEHSGNNQNCTTCHKDLNDSRPKSGTHNTDSRSIETCQTCHTFEKAKSWGSFKSFKHDTAKNESCESCHNNQTKLLKYKTDTHVKTNLTCNECHTTNAWKPANYKHQNTDTNCLSCHNGQTASGKPISHKLSKNNQCSVCHTQDKWKPAWYDSSYAHSTTGNLPPINYRGKIQQHKKSNQCMTCHDSKSDQVKYTTAQYAPTCIACHMKEFQAEYHRGADLPRLKNCLECHGYKDWDKI